MFRGVIISSYILRNKSIELHVGLSRRIGEKALLNSIDGDTIMDGCGFTTAFELLGGSRFCEPDSAVLLKIGSSVLGRSSLSKG